MSTIIGADVARLAGLQIDTLQKVRTGQMTLEQWERFNNLTYDAREERFGDLRKPAPAAPVEPTDKFAEFADLGIITVPEDYDHATCLAAFRKRHQSGKKKSFYYYNDAITDANFPNPTHILKPGDKFWVKAYRQVDGRSTTSKERMAFLRNLKAVFTGAQGATLVFDQKRDQLPKGKWYVSFDEKDRLWQDAGGSHRVPDLIAGSDGGFSFDLGAFESVWDDVVAFLCFRDLEPAQPLAA